MTIDQLWKLLMNMMYKIYSMLYYVYTLKMLDQKNGLRHMLEIAIEWISCLVMKKLQLKLK